MKNPNYNDELKKIKAAFIQQSQMAHFHEEPIDFCCETSKIEDLLQGTLAHLEKENLICHMENCDICTDAYATLAFTNALAEIVLEETSEEITSLKPIKDLWETAKDGIYRFKEILQFEIKEFVESLAPRDSVPDFAYRGDSDNISYQTYEITTITIPETEKRLRVSCNKSKDTALTSLFIEPLSTENVDFLIEIYDEKGTLLKSVDTATPITCTVPEGLNKIVVDGCNEIIINIK